MRQDISIYLTPAVKHELINTGDTPLRWVEFLVRGGVAPDGETVWDAVTQRGVINYPCAELGLCAGLTGARFTTTTEVYPDSPRATAELCNAAQVAAVCAGLDHALSAA